MGASVGALASKNRRPGDQRLAVSMEQDSPPTIMVDKSGRVSGASLGNVSRRLGASAIRLIACSLSNLVKAPPESTRSRSIRYKVDPLSSAKQISNTEASKLNEANCSTRLPLRTPKLSSDALMTAQTPRCF